MTRRRKYTDEFKRRAVRMSYSSERIVPDVAESLGVDKSMLYKWRKRCTPDGTIFHTDRGSQYTAGRTEELIELLGLKHSYSRVASQATTHGVRASSPI